MATAAADGPYDGEEREPRRDTPKSDPSAPRAPRRAVGSFEQQEEVKRRQQPPPPRKMELARSEAAHIPTGTVALSGGALWVLKSTSETTYNFVEVEAPLGMVDFSRDPADVEAVLRVAQIVVQGEE